MRRNASGAAASAAWPAVGAVERCCRAADGVPGRRGPLVAKTLRFASAFDPQSLDPHALALQYQTRVVSQIYESLVARDRNFAIEPALAVSVATGRRQALAASSSAQSQIPRRDAVYRGRRRVLDPACAGQEFATRFPVARRRSKRAGSTTSTVDIILESPDAVLPEKLIYVGIMSKAWSAAHDVIAAAELQRQAGDVRGSATPTAPARTSSRATSPMSVCVLVANPQWWGQRGKRR